MQCYLLERGTANVPGHQPTAGGDKAAPRSGQRARTAGPGHPPRAKPGAARPARRGRPDRKRRAPGGTGVTAPAPPLRGQIKMRAGGRAITHRCAAPASASSIPASAPRGPRAMDAGCLRPHSLLLFLGKRRGPRSRGQRLGGHRVLRSGAGAFFGCWEICIKT